MLSFRKFFEALGSELGALVNAIVLSPADDAPKLVAADWLDEHGDNDFAAFLRGMVAEHDKPDSHITLHDRAKFFDTYQRKVFDSLHAQGLNHFHKLSGGFGVDNKNYALLRTHLYVGGEKWGDWEPIDISSVSEMVAKTVLLMFVEQHWGDPEGYKSTRKMGPDRTAHARQGEVEWLNRMIENCFQYGPRSRSALVRRGWERDAFERELDQLVRYLNQLDQYRLTQEEINQYNIPNKLFLLAQRAERSGFPQQGDLVNRFARSLMKGMKRRTLPAEA